MGITGIAGTAGKWNQQVRLHRLLGACLLLPVLLGGCSGSNSSRQLESNGASPTVSAAPTASPQITRLEMPGGSMASPSPAASAAAGAGAGITLADGKDTPASQLLMIHAKEYGTHLFLLAAWHSITFQFPEAMKETIPGNEDTDGLPYTFEWQDNRHLRVGLDQVKVQNNGMYESMLRLDRLQTEKGEHLPENAVFQLHRAPITHWVDPITNEHAGGSQRDGYYDQLIPAPDGSAYVGVVSLGGSLGDGDGWSYAFVLERQGQAPVLVEDVFYSTIEPRHAPIAWKDSHTLVYASYYGLYEYDVDKKIRTTVFDNGSDESHNLNTAVWDDFRHRYELLVYENRNEDHTLNRIILNGSGLKPSEERKGYTKTAIVAKYSLLDMAVHPTAKGVYETRIEAGIPVTDYVPDQGGRVTVPGVVRGLAPEGVYLQRYKAGASAEDIIMPAGWWYWQPGKKEKKLADLPENTFFVYESGSKLIAQTEKGYDAYDLASETWKAIAMDPANDVRPVRGPSGLVRIAEKLPLP